MPVQDKDFFQLDKQIQLSDGRLLGYAEYGDVQGTPILYYHGGLSLRLDIAFAHSWCRSNHIRLLSIDRPGIGLSDIQNNRTLLDWPQDMDELSQQLNLGPVSLLGWSAGGPYALACALKIPHRLNQIGMVGGMCPINRPGAVEELGLLVDRILFPLVKQSPELANLLINTIRYVPIQFLKWTLEQELHNASDRQIIESLDVEEMADLWQEPLRRGTQGTVDDYRIVSGDWGFELSDISMKILLWQGEEDHLLPMSHARYLATKLRFSQLMVVPQQGHLLLRRKLSEVLSALSS